MRATDVMSRQVFTLSPGNSVAHAAQIMLDNAVSGCRFWTARVRLSACGRRATSSGEWNSATRRHRICRKRRPATILLSRTAGVSGMS